MLLLFVHVADVEADVALELGFGFGALSEYVIDCFVKVMGKSWILTIFVYFHYVKLIVKVHNLWQ